MIQPVRHPRLLIVADTPTRLGVRIALEGVAEISGEAGTIEDAILVAERKQPDLCLVGREILGDAAHRIREIHGVAPETDVVVISRAPDVDDLLTSVRAGAVGYLPETIDASGVRRVVSAVAAGEAAVPRSMVIALARELQLASSTAKRLTAREVQILGMLRRGRSTSVIAQRLAISPVTVRRHISTLRHKINVESPDALTIPRQSGKSTSLTKPR